MTNLINILTTEITATQISKCIRVRDEQTGEIFYRVESEDGCNEYTVKVLFKNGRFYPTCTCPSGQHGFANVRHASGVCKHVRWSLVHAMEYKHLQETETQFEMGEIFFMPRVGITEYRIKAVGGHVVQQLLLMGNGNLHCLCDTFGNSFPCDCHHRDFVKAFLNEFHAEVAEWTQVLGQVEEEEGEQVEG